MADVYGGFPFGPLSEPEEFWLVSGSSTTIVAQGFEEYAFRDYRIEFRGRDLAISSDVPGGPNSAFPTSGTITEIIFTSPNGSSRYVGELDAYKLYYAGYLYDGNYDDELVNFTRVVFGRDDRIFGGGTGYEGDDTYYFTGAPQAAYGVGQYTWILNGVVQNPHVAAGFDTANFQGMTGGVKFDGAFGVELMIGSSHSDQLYIGPYAEYENTSPETGSEVGLLYVPGYAIDGGSGNDVLNGGLAGDILSGSKGNDVIYGSRLPDSAYNPRVEGSLNDTINGGSGDDVIYSSVGDDILKGGSGRDVIFAGGGADTIDGGSGGDTLDLSLVPDGATWAVDLANAAMTELRDGVVVQSEVRNVNIVVGSDGADVIRGAGGAERLAGGGGADALVGGLGRDVFVYTEVSDSLARSRDRILDFRPDGRDVIDFSAIDANANVEGDQAFTFIGTDAFSGAGGELRVSYRPGGDAVLTVDVDGGKWQDMNILLRNVSLANALAEGDFIL